MKDIRLTQYSHGAGCGCKIAPAVLSQILASNGEHLSERFPNLLVGNADRDDAAVYDLGDGTAIISTTDFFMPIVDSPEMFGRIASVNAISDVYAMGGKPMVAVSILGWPVNELSAEIAGQVLHGAQQACAEAGIPLAGGHSIDSPEPIFGLAVTGRVRKEHLKLNKGAHPGDVIFLTKPLGTGIISTAQKKGRSMPDHEALAQESMSALNRIGELLGSISGVHAMTDVTGFGLGGHLVEMCEASKVSAFLRFNDIPLLDDAAIVSYIEQGCIPGGTARNFDSYGHLFLPMDASRQAIICDPQTSGGLLLAVEREAADEIRGVLRKNDLYAQPIGEFRSRSQDFLVEIGD